MSGGEVKRLNDGDLLPDGRVYVLASDHDALVSRLTGERDHARYTIEALRQQCKAEAEARDAALAERDQWVTKAGDNMKLYLDLLMQVVHVVPGETRHESARRIIQQHENRPSHGPCEAPAALSSSAAKDGAEGGGGE